MTIRTIIALLCAGLVGLTVGQRRFRGARWIRAISGTGLIYLFVWFVWGNLLFVLPSTRHFYMTFPALAFLVPPLLPSVWYGLHTLLKRP